MRRDAVSDGILSSTLIIIHVSVRQFGRHSPGLPVRYVDLIGAEKFRGRRGLVPKEQGGRAGLSEVGKLLL